MQQGKMFFIMGLCMALVQGGYVRRIPHGKEITAAISVSLYNILCRNKSFKRQISNVCLIIIGYRNSIER